MPDQARVSGRYLKIKENEWIDVNLLLTLAPSRLPLGAPLRRTPRRRCSAILLKQQLPMAPDPVDTVRLLLLQPISGFRAYA